MSTRYPGGFITKDAVAPTPSAATGIWTLDQQMQAQKTGTWPFGGPYIYIEDVFSTYLWTGNDSSQTITNGIDLSTKGGLVWIKSRAAYGHILSDTNRGTGKFLSSNTTDAQGTDAQDVTAFNTTGFTVGNNSRVNNSSFTYASWTFRKQPKFFDVVTYTGNGTTQSIAHNLGSTPGFVIIKSTTQVSDWRCFHRSTPTGYFYLNAADALETTSAANNFGNNSTVVAPTSTTITVGSGGAVNGSGQSFVAYVFAHDAGGFGLTGSDNVISCGSFTTDGSGNATVTLGYEPQWVLTKLSSASAQWVINDNMRGMPASQTSQVLYPSLSAAESSSIYYTTQPNATGFTTQAYANQPNNTVIYIAIRRGPMKVPTTGTSVFAPVTGNFTSPYTVTTNFPVDLTISSRTVGATRAVNDRLRGGTTNSYAYLNTASTAAELTGTGAGLGFDNNTAVIDVNWQTGGDALWWNFRRAPSFFDEVCYTGTGTLGQTYSHNLGVAPELIILKCRAGGSYSWPVWNKDLAASGSNRVLALNLPQAFSTDNGAFNSTAPTASVFTVGNNFSSNGGTGYTYVAYLFATCAGVSKVGSYTGTGATQTIDCGFGAGGARFVLIKRTDVSADWWVWDSARGMVAGTDPRIDLNAGNPQINANWVYTISTGFQIVTTDASVNASGGTYIFLAIA